MDSALDIIDDVSLSSQLQLTNDDVSLSSQLQLTLGESCDEQPAKSSQTPSTQDYDADDDSSSIGESTDRHDQTNDPENPSDGAEKLVRNEARVVRFLRVAVIGLLVGATLLTGYFTYRLGAKNQIDSFTRDFQNRANQFIKTYESGIGSYLYQSFTLSEAISAGLYAGYKPKFPEVTLAGLDTLATSLRSQARALDIVWSPLLTTKDERTSWETYAANTQRNSSANVTGQNKPCSLCGDGNEIANPNAKIETPGIGSYTCQTVQQFAVSGIFTSEDCGLMSQLIPYLCGCRKANITKIRRNVTNWKVSDGIFRLDNGTAVQDHGNASLSPVWQISPAAGGKGAIMFNQMSDAIRKKAIQSMIKYNIPVFSESFDPTKNAFYQLVKTPASTNGIVGVLFYPVYQSSQSKKIAGSLAIDFSWKFLFEIGLTAQSDGIVVVLENSCGQAFTFKVAGSQVEFVGEGDQHDRAFDYLMVPSAETDFLKLLTSIAPRGGFQNVSTSWGCAYRVRIYPSDDMRDRYLTNKPWVEAVVVVSIFLFTSSVFLLYDLIVRRLQAKVLNSAKRSEAIVSSLFPALVRERLYSSGKGNRKGSGASPRLSSSPKTTLGHNLLNHKIRLKTFLAQPSSEDVMKESEPIADLFPNTTILFADIAGFTAWSSEREPAQVFKLLETLYGSFDKVAKKRGVFKIETIGDCYVAVTGLPEPREDHAVVMAKFAFDCLLKMSTLTKKLEATLGPGTADLTLRIGLHSGPVTGGVLRGERARFQLFGDTMNTASRMESTGKVNHIQVSNETAQLLIKAGKTDWVEQRSELVTVKGKGEMQTYWVKPVKPKNRRLSMSDGTSSEDAVSSSGNNVDTIWGTSNLDSALSLSSSINRRDRLIAWNADLLEQFLQKIVARRKAMTRARSVRRFKDFFNESRRNADVNIQVVNEVTEIIVMPEFDEQTAGEELDPEMIDIGAKVRSQLRDYVASIASLYHDNAFHNFEHASHVVMSACKLLKRIIAPDDVDYRADESGKTLKSKTALSKEIHDTTYGISSDPLMQFSVVFSALIHDVDHSGLPNRHLVKKRDPLAITYQGKCVAEQHSVRCAWDKLMEDRYVDLRRCIYQTDEDRMRFRQLVINAIIATDIADHELQTWRQSRWNKAFHEQHDASTMDRKATLLFEYILQASDVAPTMQHWHIYQKWNQRLFEERYIAYLLGNDEEDPSLSWYRGELSFFDNYVIPLAKSLEESNVFGVSCDDYVAYALENRREWEIKGEGIVDEMVAAHKTLMTELGSEHPLHELVAL